MESFQVRLFPLPNVVFFPRTRLPLHIFEPRYRQLMRDALEGDRQMAVGLLQPGWEQDYHGNPAVHPVCCLGVIETHEELEDGRFNLTLAGLQKIKVGEVVTHTPYRTVNAVALNDRNGAGPEIPKLREQILELAEEYLRTESPEPADYARLKQLDYEGLINGLAAHLSLPTSHKQTLLEMDDLAQRGLHVARFLQLQVRERGLIQRFRHLSPADPRLN